MRLRGKKVSKAYQKLVFVNDKDGKEYACYAGDLTNHKRGRGLTKNEREKCMDLSFVLGETW